jgi:hypothetical protein
MAITLDSILNFVMPLLVIGVVIAFIWIKFLGPLIGPYFKNRAEKQPSGGGYSREIIYGDSI